MPFLAPIGVALGVGTAGVAAVGGTAAIAATGVIASSIVGGLALGAGGLLFKSLLTGPKTPDAPASLTTTSGEASSAAEIEKQADITAQKNALALARRKRTGTTLTSPQGLLSTEESSQKTLLGG